MNSGSQDRVVLTRGAAALLFDYMRAFPKAREYEMDEHDVDPLADPARFMTYELREPEHSVVRSMVRRTDNVVRPMAMWKWVSENMGELALARHGLLHCKD